MSRRKLEVGHFESLGTPMKTSEVGEVFREWTLESVEKAVGLGVQLLVLNVQVTRDLVPVVFSSPFVLGTPIHQLTYPELHQFCLHQPEEVSVDQLLIKLEHLLRECNPSVGFLIQMSGPVANDSVDCVLEVVFQGANQRCIMFSSPLPSLCTLFQYKQNMYPVTLLLDHNTEPKEMVEWATAMQLLGVNVQDEAVIERIVTDDLEIFCCWKEHHCILGSKRVGLDRKLDKESDTGVSVWTLTAANGVAVVEEVDEEISESDVKHYVHLNLPQASLSTATSCESVANLTL
jgi:glycerophosphoryl diester phosphodiesterase